MIKTIEMPKTLETLQGEKLKRAFWKNIEDGQIVYLFAQHESKKYGCGPFQVLNAENRQLCRMDSNRDFIHCPEQLYRLVQ